MRSSSIDGCSWLAYEGIFFLTPREKKRHFLNATYPIWGIGRGEPVVWPYPSSDLIPLNFLWRFMKTFIYVSPADSAEDLLSRIVVAAGRKQKTPGIFEKVSTSHSLAGENCAISYLVATLNVYFASFF